MGRWVATIEAWPYCSGNGGEADQKRAGERVQTFYFNADDFDQAAEKARLIAIGMKTNPAIYKTPITGVRQDGPQ